MSPSASTHLISDNAADVIGRALNYPMDDVVSRYAKDEGLPLQVAQEHERELKRYLALCATRKNESYGMAGPIDDLWHTFIIFTKEYAAFCNSVAGHFLHHVPNTSESTHDRTSYETFLKDYQIVYGEAPPRHIWPQFSHEPGALDCEGSGCGRCTKCSNCNKGIEVSCKGCDGCGFGK